MESYNIKRYKNVVLKKLNRYRSCLISKRRRVRSPRAKPKFSPMFGTVYSLRALIKIPLTQKLENTNKVAIRLCRNDRLTVHPYPPHAMAYFLVSGVNNTRQNLYKSFRGALE